MSRDINLGFKPVKRVFDVEYSDKPFDIFTINTEGRILVGKKTAARIEVNSRSLKKCCLIEPEMILGELDSVEKNSNGYSFSFIRMPAKEVYTAFSLINHLDELQYPFYKFVDGKEVAQPIEYWTSRAFDFNSLDYDEEILRTSVGRFLIQYLIPGSIVFDPACSTGAFLAYIKSLDTSVFTIGQDINYEMTKLAKERVDKVCLGDSLQPCCNVNSVDVVVCRHLNFDVVTSDNAKKLFISAAATLKVGGIMIVIGHTPVLLSGKWMEEQGFSALNRIGKTETGGVFQMYFLKKLGA